MATPPPSQYPTRINAPLNFRHTDTLTTTKVPHYPTKVTTGMSIIPGWNRPNANGQNANINDKDYNGPDFKPRPLKHWRRQLRVYDFKGGANNSRAAAISELDRPGTTVYHFKPDCTCVTGEGGNSYIISNNKFGYETKDDNYSKAGSDVQIQNNGYSVVPYNATTAQINDPTNPAYKVLTGVYNTDCINCSPQGNLIKSGIALQSQAFYSYSNDKLETRCQTYQQNLSTNKAAGCVYFNAQGIPLWPNNAPNGPQVVAPVNYEVSRLYTTPCLSQTIYKPNNVAFAKQGAVSGSTRLKKLVSDTVTMNGSSYYSAFGAYEANLGKYQGTNVAGNYYVKTKEVINSCYGTIPGKIILTVVDIETNSITFSWEDTGSSLCKTSYYTLTYYAIRILGNIRDLNYDESYNNNNNNNESDNNNMIVNRSARALIVDNVPVYDNDIYTDVDNNIRYIIISKIYTVEVASSTINTYMLKGLDQSTAYIAYINGTNGNGTSVNSSKVQTDTSFNSNLVMNIVSPYSYEYNDLPKILLGSASSETQSINTNNIIITSITNATNINVAYIYNNNNIQNIFKISLQNAGYFNVYAIQRRFGIYGSSSVTSPTSPIRIIKSTPTISFTNNINRDLIYGRTYILSNAVVGNTNTKKNDGKKILFNYKPSNNSVATIKIDAIVNSNNPVLYVKSIGPFYIIINTILNQLLNQNYNSVTYNTNTFTVVKSTPVIIQSNNLITSGTYGSPYIFYPSSINYNPIIQPVGSIPQILYYTITNTSPPGIASMDASGIVTISGAGTFNINAYCNSTSVYNATSLLSPLITINKQIPIITFPKSFVTAGTYDVAYGLVPATINNNIQTLSYKVINSEPHDNVVNISKIYDNTNTGSNYGSVQYSPPQSNNLQKISYEIINYPSYEGFLNSISLQQLNANIPVNYYIVSVQSDTHKVNINCNYYTYNNPDVISANTSSTTPYPAFPNFVYGILSSIVDNTYINTISIALAYPASVGVTSYFACDLFVKDIITGLTVNITNNSLTSIQLPSSGVSGGALYMYNFTCNVMLTKKQLAKATLVINSSSNASYYSSVNGNMYIAINYISILTSKCSIVSIPANVTTVQNFDLTNFSVLMHPAHSYTISLWLLGSIIQNISGYDIYSGNGTVCATSTTATPYVYGTIKQGIPITTVTNIARPIYFNGVGKFNINATSNLTANYNTNTKDSKKIVIAKEVPIITISKNLSTTCVYNILFSLPIPIATVNNNIQHIIYSSVNDVDDEIISTVATINPYGTQLLINSVGTFKIKADVKETTNLDFSQASALSNVITITKATPQVNFASTFIKQATYLKSSTYQIIGVSTTNTDVPGPVLMYLSSNTSVATISGNIVTIMGVGSFYINISCPITNNFNGLSGTKSVQSPQVTIIKDTPVIIFPSKFSLTWGFNNTYSLGVITSTNTDSNVKYTYTILSSSSNNVALLVAPTQPTQATQIKINNAGSFTLQVQSSPTQNFNSSLGRMYIIISQLTPIISFPKKLVPSWKYGDNPYIFNAATISNNDPSQTITYSVISISSPNNIAVASFTDPTKTNVTINSVGTFKILASCLASTNGNYTAPKKPCISKIISVGGEVPVITFSNNLISSVTYAYNLNYLLPTPIATVNNNVQTQSFFSYSAVEINSDIESSIASISSNGTSLITNSVGNFRIYAQVNHSVNHDYSSIEGYSSIITITPASPTITSALVIPTSWIYGSLYNIPYPTTSNTDTLPSPPVISYSTDYPGIISISGTNINIIGVGKFNIKVTIGATTNYSSPTPFIYSYTSIKATPIINFPKNFVKALIYGNNYTLLPATATIFDPLTQPITYSIYPTSSTVASIKYIKGSPYVTINSIGTFQITASCPMSTNGYYKAILRGQVLSPIIKISTDIPTATFNTNNFNSSYVYVYNSQSSPPPYTYNLSAPIASINPSNTNQTLRYSIVTYDSTIDSVTLSNIATITSNGTSINTNSAGMFKIYAEADETQSLDYGPCSCLSNVITITPASPTITSALVIPTSWVYGSPYTIPYPSTSNTDTTPGPVISYTTDYPGIISISGTTIKIISVGFFNIIVTVGATANYSSPPPFIYSYTSIQATPVITFPQKIVKSAKYGVTYTFKPAAITNNDPSQTITYSIISIFPPNTIIAFFANNTNPSVVINSVGTFQIQASCTASANGYYTATNQLFPVSPAYITVTREVPNIVLNPANFNNSYVYAYSNASTPTPYTFSASSPIASITNNTVQILNYSAVAIDSDTPSNIATFTSVGTGSSQVTSLTTTGVGGFRICTQTTNIGADYGAGNEFSDIITITSATPTILSFPALSPPPSWAYSSVTPQTYSIAYPATSNTDTPVTISYSIISQGNTPIATVSGTTITSIGVGNFQISVTIAATTNYMLATYIYPSPSTYYTFIATPVITFSQKRFSSGKYGSMYTFKLATITNNDPSQTITYSVISISPPNTIVASFPNNINPTIIILSAGTFQIQASCSASASGYYLAANIVSPIISITSEIPNIVFNNANFNNSYVYAYSNASIPTPYTFSASSPIASITNNTVQILNYSAVAIDSDTPSNIATFTSVGTGSSQVTSLTTTGVGSFRILVETMSIGLDYGAGNSHSDIITIIQATPTISSALAIPTSWVYDSPYTIPYPTTSNTDTVPYPPVISYTTDYSGIISISGTTINIIGVGNFNIIVTVGATTNYNSPPPFIYSYTSIQETTQIEFPKSFDTSAVYSIPYTFVPANFVVGDTLTQTITYSIQ